MGILRNIFVRRQVEVGEEINVGTPDGVKRGVIKRDLSKDKRYNQVRNGENVNRGWYEVEVES